MSAAPASRARLWDEAGRLDPVRVPSVGRVIATLAALGEANVEQLNARYSHAVRHDLYG